jgi:hypothetical protein
MSKPCKKDQILNPETNRCVKIDGAIGRAILEKSKAKLEKPKAKGIDIPKGVSKPCKKDQILNPETNRCVKIDGAIGKAILEKSKANGTVGSPKVSRQSKSKVSRQSKSKVSRQSKSKVSRQSKSKVSRQSKSKVSRQSSPVARRSSPVTRRSRSPTPQAVNIGDLPTNLANIPLNVPRSSPVARRSSPVARRASPVSISRSSPVASGSQPVVYNLGRISDNIKAKLFKRLADIRGRSEFKYVDEGHRKACETGDMSHLIRPIEHFAKKISLPIANYSGHDKCIILNDLDIPNFKLKYNKPGIDPYCFRMESPYNNYNKSIAFSLLDPESKEVLDQAWYEEINQYLLSLSKEDVFTLMSYTLKNGEKIVNGYLSNNLIESEFYTLIDGEGEDYQRNPFFFQAKRFIQDKNFDPLMYIKNDFLIRLLLPYDKTGRYYDIRDYYHKVFLRRQLKISEILTLLHKRKDLPNSSIYLALVSCARGLNFTFWTKVIEMFANDLNRIIMNSPPLRRSMVVFRGVKNDDYLKGVENNLYQNSGFVMTDMSDTSAVRSIDKDTGCCLKRIVMFRGTHILPISGISASFSGGLEMLLPMNSIFIIKNAKRRMLAYDNYMSKRYDICGGKIGKPASYIRDMPGARKITVTDIVVISENQKKRRLIQGSINTLTATFPNEIMNQILDKVYK